MSKIGTFGLAMAIGVTIEAVLGVFAFVSVLCGGIGPCGPTGDVPFVVLAIHQPGFWISHLLVEDSSPMYLVLSIVATAAMLGIISFIIITVFRISHEKTKRPST
jgi:hypothetical protein